MTGTAGKRRKRGQGEGTFTALPDGRVRWRAYVTTPAGEARHFNGTARNLTAAREEVREARKFRDRGELPSRERLTLADLITRYVEQRKRDGKLKARTEHDYRYTLAHYVTPSIGHLKAQGVTGLRLREFFDALGEGPRGERTREKVHALIRAAYRWGLREGHVLNDPTVRGRPAARKDAPAQAGRVKAFTPEQAVSFYQVARQHRDGWPLAFMLATGLRPGEVLGLKWSAVTLNPDGSAVVKVECTRSVMGGKVYEDTPKTAQGQRTVTVTGSAAAILRDSEREQRRLEGARLRYGGHAYQSEGHVFSTLAGTGYRPDNLRRPMGRLCREAGLPVLSPHKLRHTYTSVMAARGVPVEVLSAQLGHSDSSTTQRIYRHVFDVEREGLTFDPLPAERRAPQRVTVKARRVTAKPTDPPSAAELGPEKEGGTA